MKHEFPHKLQYAMNLSNKSQEAVDRVNTWAKEHGGSVEHLPLDQIRAEIAEKLKKP